MLQTDVGVIYPNSMELKNIGINKFINSESVLHYFLRDCMLFHIRQSISSSNIDISQLLSNFLPLILG